MVNILQRNYERAVNNRLSGFLEGFPVKHFEKSELILVQGEVPSSVFYIKKGIVKTYNLTTQGEEKPITFDSADEVFPIGWVFSQARYAQYYYEAFTDCEVITIPKEEYLDYILKNRVTYKKLLEDIMKRMLQYQMRINALEQSKASAKVLHTIHYLCLCFGHDVKKDMVQIQLPLTQQDMANFMGLTRETTGIELKKLQKQGVLTRQKQNYVVKTNELMELLNEEYDLGTILSK